LCAFLCTNTPLQERTRTTEKKNQEKEENEIEVKGGKEE
jgi:hypothetical protein